VDLENEEEMDKETVSNWLEVQLNKKSVEKTGPFFGFLFLISSLLLSAILIWLIILFGASVISMKLPENDADGAFLRNVGLVTIAFFGAPFLVWRSIIAARQAKTSDDVLQNQKVTNLSNNLSARRQITERVIENGIVSVIAEWEDDLVSRATAIDGLEALCKETPNLTPRIVRLLASYIRGTFPETSLAPTDNLERRPSPRMDLQKAIDAIGRLTKIAGLHDQSKWRIDLQNCNLSGVNFSNGCYEAMDCRNSRLEGAIFNGGNFRGALFYSSILNHATFHSADFTGAKLDHVILNKPVLSNNGSNMSLALATLDGVSLMSADLTAISFLGSASDISKTFGTSETLLSRQMSRRKPSEEIHDMAHLAQRSSNTGNISEQERSAMDELNSSGFQNWVPYTTNDLATLHFRGELYEKLGLTSWPFNQE